ncbi:hypothetical protein BX600DRAFT_517669 [Xylariales sp. PMI_506]|nr:hypothetical protein BX600DRAFT_517669 [Xylariales sp. PMI_506]
MDQIAVDKASGTDSSRCTLLADSQPTGAPKEDILPSSSRDFWSDLDGTAIETEGGSTNSSSTFTFPLWGNDVLEIEHNDSDFLIDLSGGYPLESQVVTSSNSNEPLPVYNTITLSEQFFKPSSSIPVSPSYRDPSSLFERRKFSEPDLELTGDLALHILRSYPYMLANQSAVPPFIHPKYQDLSESDAARPSPLHTALKLAKMLLHGQRMNKSLIWGLIRIEQERLLNDHINFSKWEVLEALQSLLIYILLRIIEGRHDYTEFGTQLLASLNAVCRHITAKFGMLISPDELTGQMMLWKDWVFFESRRRTATAILIINSILHAQITAPSQAMPEYSCSPAPSPLTLWHAENEADWAADYAEYLHKNAMHGMLRNRRSCWVEGSSR